MKKRVLAFLLATVFVLTLVMSVSAEGYSVTCPAPKTVRLRSKALLRIVTARLPIQAALSKV